MKKTNAIRILDQHKIEYDLFEYEVDESNLSATNVAKKIGQSEESVFKTLVLQGDKSGPLVAIIPGNAEVDLKKLAKISGNRNCEMIAMKELLPLTGYIRGGCTPIGMKKKFPTYIDESCILFDRIFISAGIRGMQVHISPLDLIELEQITQGNIIIY